VAKELTRRFCSILFRFHFNVKTLAVLILCFASVALADDLKTIDGKEYKNVTVKRVEADGIVITHSAGIAKIPFTELPKDVQERVGYDAAKIETPKAAARAAEEKQIEEQRAAKRERAERERERAEREQKAAADLRESEERFEAAEKQAAESYKITPKGRLSGQVLVATKEGENFKLGAVEVSLFARDAIDVLVAGLKAFANAKIEQLRLAAEETGEKHAEAALQQAEATLQQAEATTTASRSYTATSRGCTATSRSDRATS
jgi:type IV secretory pathway VirB10-like protein